MGTDYAATEASTLTTPEEGVVEASPPAPQTRLPPKYRERREIPGRESEMKLEARCQRGQAGGSGKGMGTPRWAGSRGPTPGHATAPPLLLPSPGHLPTCVGMWPGARVIPWRGLQAGGGGGGGGGGWDAGEGPVSFHRPYPMLGARWGGDPLGTYVPSGQDLRAGPRLFLYFKVEWGPLQGESKQIREASLELGQAEPPASSFFFLLSSLFFCLSLTLSRMTSCAS